MIPGPCTKSSMLLSNFKVLNRSTVGEHFGEPPHGIAVVAVATLLGPTGMID